MRKLNYIAAFHYGERMNAVYTNKLKNNKQNIYFLIVGIYKK